MTLLLALCGLPGVGKTTFSKNLAENLVAHPKVDDNLRVVRICFDDIYTELDQDPEGEGVGEKSIEFPVKWRKARREFIKRVGDAIRLEEVSDESSCGEEDNIRVAVVVDDNLEYRSMRHQLYQLARTLRSRFVVAHVTVDDVEALRRNELRSGLARVSKEVFYRLRDRFELPSMSNMPGDKDAVVIDTSGRSVLGWIDWANRLVENSRVPPMLPDSKEAEAERARNLKSVKHQVDLELRRLVNQGCKELAANGVSGVQMKMATTKLREARKEVLGALRSLVVESDSDIFLQKQVAIREFKLLTASSPNERLRPTE